jgi:hypothetical protein
MNKKIIFKNYYLTLFDDLTMSINDGVGYIDELNQVEVLELYSELKKLAEK